MLILITKEEGERGPLPYPICVVRIRWPDRLFEPRTAVPPCLSRFPRPRCLCGRLPPVRSATLGSRSFGLLRKRFMARCTPRFVLQCPLGCARALHRLPFSLFRSSCILFRFLSDRSWPFRWAQLYPSSSRFGQANGDRLLRRTGAVFPLANMMDLFPYKFSGLS